MAGDILQRGHCFKCDLDWVLGRVDPHAGCYGKFFCAACWDRGLDESDDSLDDRYLEPRQKRSKLPESESGGLMQESSIPADLKVTFESVGNDDRRRVVHVVSDPTNRLFKGVGNGMWLGAKVLLKCLEDMLIEPGVAIADRPLANMQILELGAGVGFPGIGLAQLGAQVVLTDIPTLCPLLQINVSSNLNTQDQNDNNQPASLATVLPLKWGIEDHISAVLKLDRNFDFIIGSDVGYDPAAFGALLSTISSFRSSTAVSPRVILAIARRPGEAEAFESYLMEAGWTWNILKEVDMVAERGDPTSSPISVFELHRNAQSLTDTDGVE